jgi:hypothetical protein
MFELHEDLQADGELLQGGALVQEGNQGRECLFG